MARSISDHEAAWLKKIGETNHLLDSSGTNQEAADGRGVFVAHAFSALLNVEGVIAPSARRKLVSIMSGLRTLDYTVHCALEREDYGNRLMSPSAAIQLDKDQVTKANYLVSFPQGSPGAFMELGFRLAPAKPTLLVRNPALVGENPLIDAEENLYIDAMAGVLSSQGVPCAIIEDTSSDERAFEQVIVPQILEWVVQN